VSQVAVAWFPWRHLVLVTALLVLAALIAVAAIRIQKRRNPDWHPRPADEQNPVLRGLGQLAEWLFLLWPF
jgi:hypothetical protein